jgi:uncharacterized protein
MIGLNYSVEKLNELCRRYHVRKLSVFGSRLRGDHGPDSDLDLLVEFDSDHFPGWEFFTLERELEDIFGVKVDLLTEGSLRERIRNQVVHAASPIYTGARSSAH